ncbi:probable receptor-like protein kinase At1g33260 [Brachypodium distachyon]|uniref:Protein kinase domain-containing protein n=1 Tax=Brachypodium distachyon TaxID=15368 RepID=A0A0Q3PTM6_BRADI|nr:probable receptor-like protein kinase At1g33260 [Brachypodium distachyon]KQJ92833.1 hypothetical protein BRADI_3g00967v3 [Brachypodium distachyon]|eukprot:XP_014756212.1 probable receptor-like protein kinase At1g33260 [Brachypodium distachyon]
MADVAMALATVFFCLLILSSAAISLLLLRLCRAALRPASSAALPPLPPPPPQELAFLVSPPPPPPPPFKEDELKKSMAAAAEGEEPRRLAWREVEALTGGFDEAAVVGRGGSSTVYLSTAASPVSPAAVKVQRWCGGGERRAAAFRRELGLLRRLRHPNLVALRAYSDDHEEGGALVLEYIAGGTLAGRLHGAGGGVSPLSWRHRMRAVHDVAAALEHLHDHAAVVHGDVSASNVLLDGLGGAQLCDLGSACECTFSAAVARGAAAVGSPGYADPFFLRTGVVSKKSDVYSFGVLLLEAVTGSPAAGDGEYLTARILPRVRAVGVEGLVDGRLGSEYDAEEAIDIGKIAVECLAAQPGLRPTMARVRASVEEKAARSIAATTGGDGHKLHDLFRMTS